MYKLSTLLRGAEGIDLPSRSGTAPVRVDRDGFERRIVDDEFGTRLTATRWSSSRVRGLSGLQNFAEEAGRRW